MGILILISRMLSFLLLKEALALQLLANYRLWDSAGGTVGRVDASGNLAFDYSGNSNHGVILNQFVYTDRGLSTTNNANISILRYYSLSQFDYQEIVISFWLLNRCISSSIQYSPFYVTFNHLISWEFLGSDGVAYIKILSNSQIEQVYSGVIQNWNLYTIRVYSLPSDSNKVYIEGYLNLNRIFTYTTISGLNIQNIPKFMLFITDDDNMDSDDIFIYEMWVHAQLSDIQELNYLHSSGSNCDCPYSCATSPSLLCLPLHNKFKNYNGDTCPDQCKNSDLSCNKSLDCLELANILCEFNLYSISTGECVFFCPENSCMFTTISRFLQFECKQGYEKISENPYACISSHCLSYHREGYKYICDIVEEGYILDSTGNCCICSDHSYTASSNPLLCVYIPNCLNIQMIEDRYICLNCSSGYIIDEQGTCNICDSDYMVISQQPFMCRLKLAGCEYSTQIGNSWICETCKEGYIQGTSGYCDNCDIGYINIEGESINCMPEIYNCIEYDYSSESKCETCESGYLVDSSYKCDICDDGYIQIADKPVICAKEVANCEKYDLANGDWICISCNLGYELYESQYCIKVIECCLEYIMINNTSYCKKCDSNSKLTCDDCNYDSACVCNEGFYTSLNNTCEKCPDHCTKCKLASTEIECGECESGYIIEDSKCIEDDASSITQLVQATRATVAISVTAGLVSMNFDKALSIMGTMQILSYILLYNIDIPQRSKVILQGLSLFTIVPNIFEYFTPNENTLNIERYEKLDFNNELFLINSGKMITVFIIVLLIIYLLKLMKHISRDLEETSAFKIACQRLLEELEWSFMIDYVISLSLELAVSSLMNLYYVSFSDTHSIIGFCISCVVFVKYIQGLLMISPLKLMLFYLRYHQDIKDNRLDMRYKALYSGLKVEDINTLINRVIYILRRLVYGITILFLYSSPYIQVVINSCFSAAVFYHFIIIKPFKSKLDYYMNLFTEIITFMILSIVGIFIKDDLSNGFYQASDWSLVVLIYLSILGPALVNTGLLMQSIREKCRGCFKKNQGEDVRNEVTTIPHMNTQALDRR